MPSSRYDELLEALDSVASLIQFLDALLHDGQVVAQVVGDTGVEGCSVIGETRHDLRHDHQRQPALQQHSDASHGLDRILTKASVPGTGTHRGQEPVLLVVAQRAHTGPGPAGKFPDAERVVVRAHVFFLLQVTLASVPTVRNMTSISTTPASNETFLLGGDLPVRRIGLGTMRLTDATGDGTHAGAHIWRAPDDPAAAIALLRRAVDLGVQLIDTADAYALGQGEELIADALHPYPDGVVIATKVGNVRPSTTEWVPLGHPGYLKQQTELSLRRLRVETIDLLQLHRLDPAYPIADQVGALAELRAQGKVRHIGLSEVTVDQVEAARQVAPIASVQNLYNLTARDHDPVIDHTAAAGIAFIPFFPLAIGEHTRSSGILQQAAQQLDVLPGQVALAWLLHRAANVLPIPGTTSITHLEQNLAASRLRLSTEQYDLIAASQDSDEDRESQA